MSFFKYSLGNHWTKILDSMSPPPASVTESALRVRKGGEKDTAREERFQGRTGRNTPTADPTKKGPASLPPLPTPHSCWPTQANRGPRGWSLTTCALYFSVYTPPLHTSSYSSQWRLQTKLYTAKKKARRELDLGGKRGKQLSPATSEQRHNCAPQADTATELVHFFKMGPTV